MSEKTVKIFAFTGLILFPFIFIKIFSLIIPYEIISILIQHLFKYLYLAFVACFLIASFLGIPTLVLQIISDWSDHLKGIYKKEGSKGITRKLFDYSKWFLPLIFATLWIGGALSTTVVNYVIIFTIFGLPLLGLMFLGGTKLWEIIKKR